MPGKKKKRQCWNCLGSHPPPTGAKCTEVKVIFGEGDDWTDAIDHADIDLGCLKSPQKPKFGDFVPHKEVPISKTGIDMYQHDDGNQNDPEWPSLRPNGTSFPPRSQNREKARNSQVHPQTNNSKPVGNSNADNPSAFEPAYRFQVNDLRQEISKLAVDSRTSKEKLNRIESLLEASLERSRDNQNHPVHQDFPGYRGRSRIPDRDRGRAPRKHHDTSPSSTSPYSSRSNSSSVSPNRANRGKSSDRDKHDKRMYKITRFLPRDERAKPLTTDKLWYCHGSFMLEQYLRGCNIEGMLRHNIFVAEKTSTRAYMSNGICRYDEAVRDRARVEGLNSYSGGDMDLAVRFLSSEYARPKNVNSGYGSGKQNQSRKANQTSQGVQARDQRKNFCWMYNGSGCNFDGCKFPHICSRCYLSGHSQHTCRVSYPQGGFGVGQGVAMSNST